MIGPAAAARGIFCALPPGRHQERGFEMKSERTPLVLEKESATS